MSLLVVDLRTAGFGKYKEDIRGGGTRMHAAEKGKG